MQSKTTCTQGQGLVISLCSFSCKENEPVLGLLDSSFSIQQLPFRLLSRSRSKTKGRWSQGYWVFIELGSEERNRKGSEIELRRKMMIMRNSEAQLGRWQRGDCIVCCHSFGYILFPLLTDHQHCRTREKKYHFFINK